MLAADKKKIIKSAVKRFLENIKPYANECAYDELDEKIDDLMPHIVDPDPKPIKDKNKVNEAPFIDVGAGCVRSK